MSDDAFRERFRVELARRGIDERDWAAEILGITPGRFCVLSTEPYRIESSKCLAFFGNGSPEFSRDYTWRTPVDSLERLSDLVHEVLFVLVDMSRGFVVAWHGDDDGAGFFTGQAVTVEDGWRDFDLARECICATCTPPFVWSTTGVGNPRFGVVGGNVFTANPATDTAAPWFQQIHGLPVPSLRFEPREDPHALPVEILREIGDRIGRDLNERLTRAVLGAPGDGANLVRVSPDVDAAGGPVTPPA